VRSLRHRFIAFQTVTVILSMTVYQLWVVGRNQRLVAQNTFFLPTDENPHNITPYSIS
jgi:hypothetical protein